MVLLYRDVHVPQAITDQLRLRGVDVLTAIEDDCAEKQDHELLEHVHGLGRVIFTQDIRFKALARRLATAGKVLCGAALWSSNGRHDRPVCEGFGVDSEGVGTRGVAKSRRASALLTLPGRVIP